MSSAVTAASSATGRSDVPAHAMRTVPLPARRSRPCCSVIARAVGVIRRAGHDRAHGVEGLAASARVTSSVWPRATMRSAMAAIWAGVLPRPRIDLGKSLAQLRDACRRARSRDPRTAPRAARRGSRRRRAARCRASPRAHAIEQRLKLGCGHAMQACDGLAGRGSIIACRVHRCGVPHRMTPAETLILATYFFVLVILAVYGWHRYYLVYLYMKNKDRQPVPAGHVRARCRRSRSSFRSTTRCTSRTG